MNTTKAIWTTVCALVLTATAAVRAPADEATTAARPEKSCTGTVASVDPKEHVLNLKEWTTMNKSFNLGDNCIYMLVDKNNGTASDLRPGERVTISYQDSHGVRIVDRVEQRPMQFEGMVKAVDTEKHTLTLHRPALDKQLQIADDCKIVLRNDKPGTLADIRIGNHVTVTYETPGNAPTARQIAQTSMAFTGTLTAIDLGEKTLKAKAMFGSKKFNVADNCAVVINGKTDGRLADLKPNDRLVFNYDEINGVNVVNRIALAEVQQDSLTTTAPMSGY